MLLYNEEIWRSKEERSRIFIKTILSIFVPVLVLVYYLKTGWSGLKTRKFLVFLLVAGVAIYYIGILVSPIDIVTGSTLVLLGTCLFFTAVGVNLSASNNVKNRDSLPPDDINK